MPNFMSDATCKKTLFVNSQINFNEFVMMLHRRFFTHVDLTDIWIYSVNMLSSGSNGN